ncbi:MAG: KDEL motif-containing protein 1-like protein [uncultured bacterium]|nr:MAG: KDEL motif-containing protein 1-like protein [uncultured bacterium]OGN59784.1 MAG: hypothetical protein A3D96_06790 [Chlamydiae bacterium RIFCSPHIGHO2_12_FULL_44_59]OGN65882.1 MAG: hypothetical protein A2978_05745 [Chlamydiae bacterium RIFCSPLOWO2_01_FULL_44_52]OGN69602.1 MAG: hypothetical protein A3F79_07380 [Chlamydiae bacterium RIFCSPLOWO2_12_FULL_45_20]
MRKAICILLMLGGLLVYQALPLTYPKESYGAIFPRKQFEQKMRRPFPQWMEEQLRADLAPFKTITASMVQRTFEKVKDRFYHYRIVDNCLYKWGKGSSRDNELEKAIKTLLTVAKIPDVDFILCPMDGLPEPYMPKDFYLTDDAKVQAPIFAKARLCSAPYIVLIPDQFSLSLDWMEVSQEVLTQDVEWEEKRERALWRGGFTDIGAPNGTVTEDYQSCPRYKICTLDPLFVDAKLCWAGSEAFDQFIRDAGVWGDAATKKQHLMYKYLPVLDGHMCTYPGYQWRLLSRSLCLKQESDQEQWFYAALKPSVHYLPIRNDMSDLLEKIHWAKEHDLEARKIAETARAFALDNLMPADDYLYLYLAFHRYAALQNIDFKKLDMREFICIQYRKRNRLLKRLMRHVSSGTLARWQGFDYSQPGHPSAHQRNVLLFL